MSTDNIAMAILTGGFDASSNAVNDDVGVNNRNGLSIHPINLTNHNKASRPSLTGISDFPWQLSEMGLKPLPGGPLT
ncbi:hypothetical protein [Herbaspirillum seropedicae]|uniref:hypothetical protein n=1 Tax=Herbaspirillum seropedicae TaxID=964 RepID=UPI0031E0CBAD